jgi:hypothetical protein
MDEQCFEPNRPSHDERIVMLQQALEKRAATGLDVTVGGESDIDLGGAPPSEYHRRGDSFVTIPEDSPLFQSIVDKDSLPSREQSNTWDVLGRRVSVQSSVNPASELYDSMFNADVALEPSRGLIAHSRSTYAAKKLLLDGLSAYSDLITPAEEVKLCAELLRLLQHRSAAFIVEEGRHCINLYEHELSIPRHDPLAFSMHQCPLLMEVIHRLFHLHVIPVLPNVCQVSEFVTAYSGYPVHKKPSSIGPYYAMLNLVSSNVLYLQHISCPWRPRLRVAPRAVYVFEGPCLAEYKMGYRRTHQPFHNFNFETRLSSDYRIEVAFAAVDTAATRYLRDAVAMTEYARTHHSDVKRLEAPSGASETASWDHCGSNVDSAIGRLTAYDNGCKAAVKSEDAQRELLPFMGTYPRQTRSAAKDRLEALKKRHDTAIEGTRVMRGRGTAGAVIRGAGQT